MAGLSELAERFEDEAKTMHTVAKEFGFVEESEFDRLNKAYKNVVGSKRSSWRSL